MRAEQWRAVWADPWICRRGAGGVGWCVMGSGSSKATSSSSSPTAAEAGAEVKRPNGSGKGRRGRSLLPLPSSSCFRGSTTPCEGDASAAAVDVEVRRAFPLGFVSLPVLRICACWHAVNRAKGRVSSQMECGYVVDLVDVNLLLRESSD